MWEERLLSYYLSWLSDKSFWVQDERRGLSCFRMVGLWDF